jgi:hypothetical protein
MNLSYAVAVARRTHQSQVYLWAKKVPKDEWFKKETGKVLKAVFQEKGINQATFRAMSQMMNPMLTTN